MDRLWVIARVELHLTEDEFAALDYRQFSLLHERTLALRWQDQWQQGAIIAAIHNHAFGFKYDPPRQPGDYVFTVVPGQKQQAVARLKKPRMTKKRREEITNNLRTLFQALAARK